MTQMDDTIVALSSGALPAGLAVLRLSGPDAFAAAQALSGSLPAPRRASLRRFRDPTSNRILDHGLLVLFPGPGSATGEDLAEFHLHGGRAVVAAVLAALTSRPGLRLAQAGEFTRRAFENGRIDLTEAEGLADLLSAETEGQRQQALDHAGGAFRRLVEGWMERLTHARAMLEADFDFSDEDDVSEDVADNVSREMQALRQSIGDHLENAQGGEIMRDGFQVAIVGPPNAGKSSLLNALADRDAAIVSDIPGTTRDRIEVSLDLAGVPVRLIDTAGLRQTEDAVERQGIERAREAARSAHLVLHLRPAATWEGDAPDLLPGIASPILSVATKCDLVDPAPNEALAISVRTGAGLDALVQAIAERARAATRSTASVVPTRARHRALLQDTAHMLDEALVPGLPVEVQAELLRLASQRLGALVGQRDVEDLLDLIFSQFCIGK